MKSLTNATNGFMIISDSFMTAIFKQSLLRTFAKDEQGYLKMGFNGTFEVLVSLLGFNNEHKLICRQPKNSRFLGSSDTSSLPTRNRHA